MQNNIGTAAYHRAVYLFSDMPADFNDGWDEFRWASVSDIPDCKKYNINSKVPPEFILPPGTADHIKITLPIWEVLSSMNNDALLLRTVRWDRIKSQLSKGTIEYPEVYFDDGAPIQDLLQPNKISMQTPQKLSLLDGRHRLVALMKFYNLQDAPFICTPSAFEKIIQFVDKKKIKYSLE